MTTVSTLVPGPSTSSKADAWPKKPSMLRQALHALLEARQRQADRELAQILSRRGGLMGQSEANGFQASRRTDPFHTLPALKSD